MIQHLRMGGRTQPPALLGRSAIALYSVALAYGGGLWLHLLHEAEGATELNAPHTILHWLRDSTLALPLIIFGVYLAAQLSRRLLERFGAGASRLTAGAVVATVVAFYAAIVVAAGNPLHGVMFGGEHGGHDLPLAAHLVRDGLLALTADLAIAAGAVALLAGRQWLTSRVLAVRSFATRAAFSMMMVFGATFGSVAQTAVPVDASTSGTIDSGTCPATAPLKTFSVSAIDITMPLNRFGDHDAGAHMYALNSKIGTAATAGTIRYQEAMFNNPATQADSVSLGLNGFPVMQADGTAKVVEDAIQPLAIRANGGDCVVVNFSNKMAAGNVGMHIDGLNFQMTSSADAVGNNPQSGVAAGGSATYTFFVPNDPALEGSHYVHPGPSNRGLVNHGLFGTLTVEAPGSTYVKPDGTPVTDPGNDSDWERVIVPGAGSVAAGWCQAPAGDIKLGQYWPNGAGACAPFRENIKVHQDIGNESEPILDKNGNALPTVDPHTHAYRPGSRGLNYRSEPFMDRLNLNPDQKSQTYGSYTFSDPATIVPRGYQGDPTKFRIVHAGSEVFHVYHLHGGAIRWRFNPRADLTWDYSKTGLDKHPQVEQAQSFQLDAQEIGPGESYNLEIEGGAGSNQYGAGEFLFHCHIAEHYFSGMWGFWRVFDTAQPDIAPLPGKTKPAEAIDSTQLIGKTFNGTLITQANLDNWIRPQLPAQGVKQLTVNTVGNGSFSQDGSVLDWVVDPATGTYLGEKENTSAWVDLPRLGDSSTAAGGGGSNVPLLKGHPGSLIADRVWFGKHPTSNRPAILFNPNNGRPAYPLLRAHPGDRPPLAPNGHSGAPYLGEKANDTNAATPLPYQNRTDAICPTEPSHGLNGAQIRRNAIVALPLVVPHTESAAQALAANPALANPINFDAAWSQNIDQKGGIFALAQNKPALKQTEANPTGAPGVGPDGAEKPIEPLALRANVGDCLFNTLVSEEKDGDPELPYAKANIHIHHVQFDTQASDGVISGFSFDQSVRPYQVEDAQLTAAVIAGSTKLPVASVSQFLNPDGTQRVLQSIAVGEGLPSIEIHKIVSVDVANKVLTLDGALTANHASGEYAGNEFVQYMWYPDIALDNIFYHDHVNGVFGWSHGFVGQLVIEPRGSTYRNPKAGNTGVELSSGAQADIVAATGATQESLAPGQVDGSYREQVIWNIDNHSTATPAAVKLFLPAENSINLRSEPWADRLAANNDPSLLFSSYAHGDPYTPMPRAYVGDPVVIRTVNVSQNVNDLQIDGHRFSTEPRMTGKTKTNVDPETGITKIVSDGTTGNVAAKLDTYHAGISERETLFLEGGAGGLQQKAGDYLYHDGLGTAFRNGAWGLIRVLDGSVPDLELLPGRTASTSAPSTLGSRGIIPALAPTDAGNPCPSTALVHRFAISAVRVPNAPVGAQNAFVATSQAAAVQAGQAAAEPLALHVSAGECVEVTLTNDPQSGLANVSFNVGRVISDPKSSGVNAGYTKQQGVASGASKLYRYFVDSDRIGSAAIAGFGGTPALGITPTAADAARNGLYGALVVAPAGYPVAGPDAKFTDPISGAKKDIGTQVDVRTADGKGYRDFSLVLMETDPQIGTSHMPYPTGVSGPALVNYQAAQGWSLAPRSDDQNAFSSATYGDPKTPILQGYPGDPTRVHVVGAPGSEQMHVVSLGGLSFPLDPNLNNSLKLQNRALGSFETLDAYLDGGMGGRGQVTGDFVYQDRRLPYTQAGMWGLIRSLGTCTNVLPLPGATCVSNVPAPVTGTTTDIQLSGSANNGGPSVGSSDSYVWQVKNGGSAIARGVTFKESKLPATLRFQSASVNVSGASCATASDGTLSCSLGDLPVGQQAVVTVNFTVLASGTFTTQGSASFTGTDTQPSNNTVSVTIQAK